MRKKMENDYWKKERKRIAESERPKTMWLVYSAIAHVMHTPSGHDPIPPTIEEIAERLELGEDEVRKCIRELASRGVLVKRNFVTMPRESHEGEWDYDRPQLHGRRWTVVEDLPDTREGHMAEVLNMLPELEFAAWARENCRKSPGRIGDDGYPEPPFERYVRTEGGLILHAYYDGGYGEPRRVERHEEGDGKGWDIFWDEIQDIPGIGTVQAYCSGRVVETSRWKDVLEHEGKEEKR